MLPLELASHTPIQPTVPHDAPAAAHVVSAVVTTEPLVPDAVANSA